MEISSNPWTHSTGEGPVSPALEKQREKRRLTAAKNFGDVAVKWLADARMTDSTRAMRKHVVDRDILPAFQNRLLNEITADDLRALCNKVKARGAPATAAHVRDIVKQVYAFASQYCSHEHRALLDEYGLIASMSARGNCYDNAAMESWNHSLKVEAIHGERFKTREQARAHVFEYIEVDYNRNRLHSTLDYLSPEQFEQANVA